MEDRNKRLKVDPSHQNQVLFIDSLRGWLETGNNENLEYARAYCLVSSSLVDPVMKYTQMKFLEKDQSLDWTRTYAQQLIDMEELKLPLDNLMDRFISKYAPEKVNMDKFVKELHQKVEEEYYTDGLVLSIDMPIQLFDKQYQQLLLETYLVKLGFKLVNWKTNVMVSVLQFNVQIEPPLNSLGAQWKDHQFGTRDILLERKLYSLCMEYIELQLQDKCPVDIPIMDTEHAAVLYSTQVIQAVNKRLIEEGFRANVIKDIIIVRPIKESVGKRFMELYGL